jgi:beta-carotene 3-hydroxylase
MLINVLLVIASFAAMEGVAWFTHKYIMHGFLWSWHKSHHHPHEGILERNDLFGILFAIPAAATIYIGAEYPAYHWLLWIGIGITLYGIAYFIFHDIIVHRRVKLRYVPRNLYLRRIIRAHKVHHRHQGRDQGEAFGFLYSAKDYLKRDSFRKFS